MILERLTAVGDGARGLLRFDDGTKTRVPVRVVTDLGLYAGMSLEEEDLAEILDAARQSSARERALRIVSATGISQRSLRDRLIQRGERPEDAQAAVDWLKDMGAVDDGAMAAGIVRRCVEQGYGVSRARQELYRKGIPKTLWEDVLADYPEVDDAVDRFLAKRLHSREPDQKELQRTIAALQRRGHSWDTIRAALRRYRISIEEYE